MSIVAVHGPSTFGSKAVVENEEIIAVVNPTNGLKWTFRIDGPTTRPNQDFSWAFPTNGTPTPQTVINPTEVTYATAGSKTVTLTINATARTIQNKELVNNVATVITAVGHGFIPGQRVTITGAIGAPFLGTWTLLTAVGSVFTFACVAADVTSALVGGSVSSAVDQYPTTGTHQIVITAVAGAGPLMAAPTSEGEDDSGDETSEEVAIGFDPAAHTVDDVKAYVEDHPDQAGELLAAEQAGKGRLTLISYLEDLIPYDPADDTVAEVIEYAEANPESIDDLIAAEEAGKNRTTLLSQLEALRDA